MHLLLVYDPRSYRKRGSLSCPLRLLWPVFCQRYKSHDSLLPWIEHFHNFKVSKSLLIHYFILVCFCSLHTDLPSGDNLAQISPWWLEKRVCHDIDCFNSPTFGLWNDGSKCFPVDSLFQSHLSLLVITFSATDPCRLKPLGGRRKFNKCYMPVKRLAICGNTKRSVTYSTTYTAKKILTWLTSLTFWLPSYLTHDPYNLRKGCKFFALYLINW